MVPVNELARLAWFQALMGCPCNAYDGASKGKIERYWRTLRSHVLDRLDLNEVKTLDALNVRLMTWVTSEYNQRPHAGLSGRTPLSVFEEEAEQFRFVEDPETLESAFEATFERKVKNDSTCAFRGKVYEVPPHLRGRKVTLRYKLLRPTTVWIEDGGTQVVLREVDCVANATRARRPAASKRPTEPRPRTGLNAIEGLLGRALRPDPDDDDRSDNDQGGTACARS